MEEKEFPELAKYQRGLNDRIIFSKISGSTPLPNLVEIQTDSFKQFIDKGLDEVFKEVFPISSYSNQVSIIYDSCHFEAPEYTPLECKEGDLTYSAKLKVSLRLQQNNTGEIRESNEVFMGDIPMMTDSGTFIVNGAERVVVSQIVRSPGAYFQDTIDKSGVHIYNGEIIPNRGTWLQFESDLKGVLWVRIDRQRKMPAVVLFKALGLTESEITKLFGEGASLKATIEKDKDITTPRSALIDIFRKLKPGEPVTPEGVINFLVQKFFDDKRYDLGKAGRFKYTVKLGIYGRLAGRVLAEDLKDNEGNVFINREGVALVRGSTLSKDDVEDLRNAEFFEHGAHTLKLPTNDKLDDHNIVNLVKVYAHDKKDQPIVNIIGTDLNLTGIDGSAPLTRVSISDMVACFSYFINIQDGIGQTDDIDHLGNRRVRSVGELLQTQFRIGLTKMSKTVQQKMSISSDLENVKPQGLINIRPLTTAIREFFASSQLSQFMDQVNPLAELTNKRRISALGPGGLTRDRASMEVRDVHYTHYGRICPIETPEGQNIGLINNLATYAKINQYGFIQTPYREVHHITLEGELIEMISFIQKKAIYGTLNRLFWENNKPINERKIQIILENEFETYFYNKNIDISREVLTGNGQIDFKFFKNKDEKILIEVKIASSSYLKKGYEKQILDYLHASNYKNAFYLIVCFTDEDYKIATNFIKENIYTEHFNLYINISLLDVRKRKTASKK